MVQIPAAAADDGARRSWLGMLAGLGGAVAGVAMALAGGVDALAWVCEVWQTYVVDAFARSLFTLFMC